MNKKPAVILFLAVALALVVAAILMTRKPIKDDSWNGSLSFTTTTPTLTLLPEAGWWNNLPTAGAHVPTPASGQSSTLTPTP